MIECPLSEDLVKAFLHPTREPFTRPSILYCPKGNLTRAWELEAEKRLGAEAYAHLNYDTFVTDGQIGLLFQSYRHPQGVDGAYVPKTDWLWAADEVRKGYCVRAAQPDEIERVPADVRERVALLPSLQYKTVQPYPIWSYGRGKPKKKIQPPPEGVLFFAFTGGVGFCVQAKAEGKRKRKEVAA